MNLDGLRWQAEQIGELCPLRFRAPAPVGALDVRDVFLGAPAASAQRSLDYL
jgi:hypothetical protein